MKLSRQFDAKRQGTVLMLSWMMFTPTLLGTMPVAYAQFGKPQAGAPRQGMSTGKKVALVGGAALLYYLFKRNQAKKAEQVAAQRRAGATVSPAQAPQLYRSKNGGVYYRDAQKRPVWLTVPSQSVQVSTQDLQRYAPDYNRYRGAAPAAPRGYTTQPFEQFDNAYGGGNDYGGGSAIPPGPGGNY
ncbi:MAG: hypothetical protein H7Y38_07795 [Armatimonadetes bacterium]|nr:hypothetical protein [Armatimonadota bacterium]